MKELQDLLSDKNMKAQLSDFLKSHGKPGLKQAMQFYSNMQQEYVCKTKDSIAKIKLEDILYLEIQKHTITIHTASSTYQKYGSLSSELNILPPKEFIQCRKNCIVALRKIQDIRGNELVLFDHTVIHMSRNYASPVIIAFLALSTAEG